MSSTKPKTFESSLEELERIGRQLEQGELTLEKSLERLRTDYIDIYQLHNPPLMMLERGAHYAVLDELKQEGKIRYYGVSVHDAYEGTMAIATGKPDVIQVAYNFLRQDPREDLLPFAQEHDIGLIIREPLAGRD